MNTSANDNILSIDEPAPGVVLAGVASRVRARRLEMNLTQSAMAGRAGMPLATYRRFERSGEISLKSLILIAAALGMTADIEHMFSERRYASIDEVIGAGVSPLRKRGRRND